MPSPPSRHHSEGIQRQPSMKPSLCNNSPALLTIGNTCKKKINEDERAGRRKAVDGARDSVGISGFTITPEFEAMAQRYVAGEIELAELINHNSSDGIARITISRYERCFSGGGGAPSCGSKSALVGPSDSNSPSIKVRIDRQREIWCLPPLPHALSARGSRPSGYLKTRPLNDCAEGAVRLSNSCCQLFRRAACRHDGQLGQLFGK